MSGSKVRHGLARTLEIHLANTIHVKRAFLLKIKPFINLKKKQQQPGNMMGAFQNLEH